MKNDATTYTVGDYRIRVYENNFNPWECKLCGEKNMRVWVTINYKTWGSLCRKCSRKYGLDVSEQRRIRGIALLKLKGKL